MIKYLRISLALGLLLAVLFTFGWTGTASASSTTRTVTTTTSQATSPLATTCFGGAFTNGPFTLSANTVFLLPSQAPWFVTTGVCLDINVNFSELTAPMQMQVCFIRTGTCNSWKTVSKTGTWYQIATNVLGGTQYRFGIKTTQKVTYKMKIAD